MAARTAKLSVDNPIQWDRLRSVSQGPRRDILQVIIDHYLDEAQRMSKDPMEHLVLDLREFGKASRGWIQMYQFAGREPLHVAWLLSHDSTAMMTLLSLCGLEHLIPMRTAILAVNPVSITKTQAAKLLRQCLPTPPTLAEAEAAVRVVLARKEREKCCPS